MIGRVIQALGPAFFVIALGSLMAGGSYAITYKLSIQVCGGGDKPVEFLLTPVSRFDSLRVMGLTVMSEGDERQPDGIVMWQISADPVVSETGKISAGVDLHKIVYGIVPEGFSVIHEAVHLKCGKSYVVTVSAAGHIGQLNFTPGKTACRVPNQNPSEH